MFKNFFVYRAILTVLVRMYALWSKELSLIGSPRHTSTHTVPVETSMHTHIHTHTQAHRTLNCAMRLCMLVCAELGVGQSSGLGFVGGGSQRRGHLGMRTSVYREILTVLVRMYALWSKELSLIGSPRHTITHTCTSIYVRLLKTHTGIHVHTCTHTHGSAYKQLLKSICIHTQRHTIYTHSYTGT